MGLDVYLYKYNRDPAEVFRLCEEATAKLDAEFTRIQAELAPDGWDWGKATKEQKDEVFRRVKEFKSANGYDDDEPEGLREKIENDSAVYPEHMFKVGYMRSSYNEGGINRILANYLDMDLGDIFPSEKDDYERTVDWPEALKRARDMRDRFTEHVKKCGPYTVIAEFQNPFTPPSEWGRIESPKQALDIFLTEKAKREANPPPPDWNCYSNGDGTFFFGDAALEVVGMMLSVQKKYGGTSCPGVYLVTKSKDGKSPLEWYQHALEIVVEMCEWVLGQPEPERFLLHWSG